MRRFLKDGVAMDTRSCWPARWRLWSLSTNAHVLRWLGLRALLCACLISALPVAQAAWRSRYVAPNQSEDKSAPAPTLDVDTSVMLVSVPLAHELQSARGPYCSPEVAIYNNSAYILKDLVLRIDYFQKAADDKSTPVGSTVTRVHMLAPRSEKRETFYVLDATHCKGLHGVARVQLCLVGMDIECTPQVGFSSGGRVPLHPGPPGEGNRLQFAPPRAAPAAPVPPPPVVAPVPVPAPAPAPR